MENKINENIRQSANYIVVGEARGEEITKIIASVEKSKGLPKYPSWIDDAVAKGKGK